MGCLCFSISKHLTTRPCLRIAFFLQLHGCVFPFWFMTHFEFRFEVKLMTSGLGMGRKHLSTIDSQVWETKSHFSASFMKSSSICSQFLLEWDMIQMLSDHNGIACLMCLFSLSKSRKTPIFLDQFSSTLATTCVAICCYNREASTLPCQRHLLKEKLFSTHSNIAFPSSPDISRKRAAINHPCVS